MNKVAPRGRVAGQRRRAGPGPSRPAPPASERVAERIQKVLARAGLGSRRQVEAWIAAGRLTINGEPATAGAKITLDDRVFLDGRVLRLRATPELTPVFVCNRSPGDALRPGSDSGERSSLLERLPSHAGKRFMLVSPMPRVDGGLEIATADGALADRLQRAVRGIEVEFSARVRGELSAMQVATVLRGERDAGVPIAIRVCEPAAEEAAEAGNRWYRIVALGASGNELRHVLERCGLTVSRILRTRMGALDLPRDLPRGAHRAMPGEAAERALLARPQLGVD
jgi:23S rRNA pseudouridine2605 synthase